MKWGYWWRWHHTLLLVNAAIMLIGAVVVLVLHTHVTWWMMERSHLEHCSLDLSYHINIILAKLNFFEDL